MNFRLMKLVVPAIFLLVAPNAYAASATAKRVGCFIEVKVPAKYSINKIKIRDSYREYHKYPNGRIDLMEFPAQYRETRTLVENEHIIMREIVCK